MGWIRSWVKGTGTPVKETPVKGTRVRSLDEVGMGRNKLKKGKSPNEDRSPVKIDPDLLEPEPELGQDWSGVEEDPIRTGDYSRLKIEAGLLAMSRCPRLHSLAFVLADHFSDISTLGGLPFVDHHLLRTLRLSGDGNTLSVFLERISVPNLKDLTLVTQMRDSWGYPSTARRDSFPEPSLVRFLATLTLLESLSLTTGHISMSSFTEILTSTAQGTTVPVGTSPTPVIHHQGNFCAFSRIYFWKETDQKNVIETLISFFPTVFHFFEVRKNFNCCFGVVWPGLASNSPDMLFQGIPFDPGKSCQPMWKGYRVNIGSRAEWHSQEDFLVRLVTPGLTIPLPILRDFDLAITGEELITDETLLQFIIARASTLKRVKINFKRRMELDIHDTLSSLIENGLDFAVTDTTPKIRKYSPWTGLPDGPRPGVVVHHKHTKKTSLAQRVEESFSFLAWRTALVVVHNLITRLFWGLEGIVDLIFFGRPRRVRGREASGAPEGSRARKAVDICMHRRYNNTLRSRWAASSGYQAKGRPRVGMPGAQRLTRYSLQSDISGPAGARITQFIISHVARSIVHRGDGMADGINCGMQAISAGPVQYQLVIILAWHWSGHQKMMMRSKL
ncbi:hypothetical protein FB45DRAFT_1014466 [Roridomyces roridus]|uniref:Uncharacterized protein n=1 Tax=Roridomyces roridus TaxID=1738132 RepID=A0AAD7AY28_9AGAR|nr:hypothetical protein FB45DRAFT_1014466 [Roridomyces roridus]